MKMQENDSEYDWNNIKANLKKKFPILTDSDLLWREGTNESDLMKDLAVRIGISWAELEKIIDNLKLH